MPDRFKPSGPASTDSGHEEWLLMQRVASGEEAAIAELYDRFGALVYKVARQVLTGRAEAEDAVQEVFVRLWQSADRFDPHRAKLVTWVMLIARRHLIDQLRRRGARPNQSQLEEDWAPSADDAPPEQSMIDKDRNVLLMEKIAELPELQRLVIEKAYFQGFTLREISEQLDAPLGTIKSALSRGLARLRERSDADQAM